MRELRTQIESHAEGRGKKRTKQMRVWSELVSVCVCRMDGTDLEQVETIGVKRGYDT